METTFENVRVVFLRGRTYGLDSSGNLLLIVNDRWRYAGDYLSRASIDRLLAELLA